MKKRFLVSLLLLLIVGTVLYSAKTNRVQEKLLSPLGSAKEKPEQKPLRQYTFENLRRREFSGSEITFGKLLKQTKDIRSYLFYFTSENKKVSGLANIPFRAGEPRVVLLLRGYVDPDQYSPGEGTRRAGEVLAKRGFLTLAPDFLGYGESASPAANPIEERFEKYTTTLNLLASIKYLPKALVSLGATTIKVKTDKVALWGHSNGGQIALSILSITGKKYPTVLWAPVSKPFPYSILYYTDESEDHGKALRKVIAEFETDYDIEKYSPTNYLDWINTKTHIQLHQGSNDDAVPKNWSDELYRILTNMGIEVDYYIYPGEDHNFSRGNWTTVVSRTISFYNKELAE